MPALRNKKGRYYGYFYDRGRRPREKWVSLNTSDKTVARQRLTRLEREYSMGLADPWVNRFPSDGITVAKLAEQYLAARDHRRPKTQLEDRKLLRALTQLLTPDAQISHVEPHHLRKLLPKELSDSTRQTYYTRLNAFFRWCLKEGHLKSNPLDGIPRPKVGRKTPVYLEPEDYQRLLTTIDAYATVNQSTLKEGEILWMADVVRVAVGTGLRLGEICSLRWVDVNLSTGFVTVRNRDGFRTKSGHDRSLYVTGEARETLVRLDEGRTNEDDLEFVFKALTGGQMNSEYVSKRFKYFVRLAGLQDEVSFHSLRHTYASWLVIGGVDLYRVKELLGHASIETTMRYAHLAPKHHIEAVESVFGTN